MRYIHKEKWLLFIHYPMLFYQGLFVRHSRYNQSVLNADSVEETKHCGWTEEKAVKEQVRDAHPCTQCPKAQSTVSWRCLHLLQDTALYLAFET